LRINPGTTTIANGQSHVTIASYVDAIESFLFGGERGFRSIDFEVLAITIEASQPYRGCSFNDAQRHTFISKGDDSQ
jgi:hypothetical protein